MKTRKITAYLRFSGFERKMKIELLREIRIQIKLPISANFDKNFNYNILKKTPVLVFEWKKQLTKYTHEYYLKEIS